MIYTYKTIKNKYNYIAEKILQYYKLIEIEVRNIFAKDLLSVVLKCVVGFNICGTRDYLINTNKLDLLYSQYSELKIRTM